jgi:hypothetical protein
MLVRWSIPQLPYCVLGLSLLLLATLSACHKMGLADPRTMPEDAQTIMGPKRPPIKNIEKQQMQGSLNPAAGSSGQSGDGGSPGNFWSASSGWSMQQSAPAPMPRLQRSPPARMAPPSMGAPMMGSPMASMAPMTSSMQPMNYGMGNPYASLAPQAGGQAFAAPMMSMPMAPPSMAAMGGAGVASHSQAIAAPVAPVQINPPSAPPPMAAPVLPPKPEPDYYQRELITQATAAPPPPSAPVKVQLPEPPAAQAEPPKRETVASYEPSYESSQPSSAASLAAIEPASAGYAPYMSPPAQPAPETSYHKETDAAAGEEWATSGPDAIGKPPVNPYAAGQGGGASSAGYAMDLPYATTPPALPMYDMPTAQPAAPISQQQAPPPMPAPVVHSAPAVPAPMADATVSPPLTAPVRVSPQEREIPANRPMASRSEQVKLRPVLHYDDVQPPTRYKGRRSSQNRF